MCSVSARPVFLWDHVHHVKGGSTITGVIKALALIE